MFDFTNVTKINHLDMINCDCNVTFDDVTILLKKLNYQNKWKSNMNIIFSFVVNENLKNNNNIIIKKWHVKNMEDEIKFWTYCVCDMIMMIYLRFADPMKKNSTMVSWVLCDELPNSRGRLKMSLNKKQRKG
jgi:hypothetical protein